jgi:hypothetical protein
LGALGRAVGLMFTALFVGIILGFVAAAVGAL